MYREYNSLKKNNKLKKSKLSFFFEVEEKK